MKRYVLFAHQQGMNQGTVVTALADGAKIAGPSSLSKTYCQRLESILDWFHIAKSSTVKTALGDDFRTY